MKSNGMETQSNPFFNLSQKLLDFSDKLNRVHYFIAIRRGLVLSFPLIMIGALALLVCFPPFNWTHRLFPEDWIENINATCNVIVSGTFGIAALVSLFGFSSVLTELHIQNRQDQRASPAITSMIVLSCFFIIAAPTDNAKLLSALSLDQGLLTAVIVASFAGTLFLKLSEKKYLQMPINTLCHDPLVGDVFFILPAGMVTILTFALIKMTFTMSGSSDVIASLNQIVSVPFHGADPNLFFAICYTALTQILWFFGLHGPNLLNAIQEDILIPASVANNTAVAQGLDPQFTFTSQFFDAFVRMGGSGSTLCLIIALLFVSKSANSRKFALIALLPALCNINEPLLFGIPLVLNPVFAIPFVLVPIVHTITSYIAITMDWMPMTSHFTTWTNPALLSGYMVTGSAFSGAIVQGINLALGSALYYPFVKMSENLAMRRNKRTLVTLLDKAEDTNTSVKQSRLIGLYGEEGRMAISLADGLYEAMRSSDQLFLEYQPQVDIKKKRVIGAEGLLRWEHPNYGRIAPPITVTLAEDLGIIDKLGLKILETACRQRMEWRKHLPDDFLISVNVSPKQLIQTNFDLKVMEILKKTGMPPEILELEITETTALLPEVHSLQSLEKLHDQGVRIALDDFGMGHTSLHYLRLLPFDIVKIDRSLTTKNVVNDQIVKSIEDLSRSLNISTIVEGVESDEQVTRFAALGCSAFQGYLFSRPIAAGKIVDYTNSIGNCFSEDTDMEAEFRDGDRDDQDLAPTGTD